MLKNRTTALFVAIVALSATTSCVKSISSNREIPAPETANTFDFATTWACPLNLDFGLNYSILMEVYTENPMGITGSGEEAPQEKNTSLIPVYKAITSKDGKISETMELPKAVKTIYLYTEYFGIPSVIPVGVTASGVNFTLSASAKSTQSPVTLQTKAGEVYPKGLRVLGGWNPLGVPDYLTATRANHPAGLLYDLNKALPNTFWTDKQASLINTYLDKGFELNLHLVKSTRLSLIFAHENATKYNSIGYFHYPTATPPASVAEIQPILAFPNCSYPTYSLDENGKTITTAGDLASGDQIALKYWDGEKFTDEFPAGTTVGFVVFDSAFRNGEILDNRNRYYSITAFNDKYEPEKCRQHCIAFESKSRNLVAYTFEDAIRNNSQTEYYTGGNFRDNLFYIKPSVQAPFNTGNMLQLVESENPAPQPDENTMTYAGTLAFEDIWPYKGDYDMNDIIIEYESTHYRNTSNRVLRAVDEITYRHRGGEIISGFGYQFSKLKSYHIAQVQVTPGLLVSSSIFKTDEKGLEAGNEATVVLFDHSKQVPVGTTFTVETTFSNPPADKEVVPPYNPFIVINTNQGRGQELHLPGHTPTALMDKTLLGKGNDKSDPAKGIYFAGEGQYPFAIKIPVKSFNYPVERQNISEKYPQFIDWVDSKGTAYEDWYLHPVN